MKNGTFDTVVLYPNGGVSEIQEKQMLYYTNERTHAYAIKGNFDDCQSFVKSVFSSYPKDNGVLLSSANSINIGRLVPQVIYYVYAYCRAVKNGNLKKGEEFTICVPTGNFGDIFAGYLASLIGVPITKFICASNVNNVLTDFFEKGVYDKNREFFKSNSPAMDILVSSNLERLVFLATGRNGDKVTKYMNELKASGKYQLSLEEKEFLKDFVGGYSTEEETIKAIGKCYKELNYLIDPHTAVAYDVYNKLEIQGKTLIVSTASPYKFPFTVTKALNLEEKVSEVELIKDISSYTGVEIPFGIKKLMYSKKPTVLKSKEEIRDIVNYKNLKVEISVPCTTANLGVGLDGAGLALNLYNSFIFESAEQDAVVGFGSGKLDNNLILKAYRKLFEVSGKNYIPVKISPKKCSIPTSSGLGSSASCIVAGVMAANYMLKNLFDKNYLLSVMASVEGHPDNVAPALLGGLTLSYQKDGKVVSKKAEINKNLKFYAVVPRASLSTKEARSMLPENVSLKDAVHNVTRALNLSYAFEKGDVELLKDVFDDKLHQPYRLPTIKSASEMKAILENEGCAVAISGAGPTLFAVSLKDGLEKVVPKSIDGVKWKVKPLKVCEKGATLK
jgi:threonine synthase